MNRHPISRRRAITAMAAGVAAAAPLLRSTARASALESISYHTSWRPQAEQGGFYQALATGLYKEHGLDVTILKGGPQMNISTLLLAGRVDFIESNGFAVLNFIRETLPATAVAAFFQKDPRVLLSHPGVGNDTLPALKGKTILVATSGRQTYWQWLRAKYGFTDDQVRPYTFSMAPFLADKSLTQQGLLTSEPFDMARAGVKPVIHLLADHGFEHNLSMVVTSPKMIKEKPDVVRRFVEASAKGWASYLAGDPSPANALIRAGNPDMSVEKMAYAREALKKHAILQSGPAATLGLGAMTAERWKSFYESMAAVGAQPKGLDVTQGYTLEFTNKRIGV